MPPLAWLAIAAVPTGVVYAALLGLGMHRHGSPFAISALATLLCFGPALAVAAASPRELRPGRLGAAQLAWVAVLWLVVPVYFPGERRDAVATGLALLGSDGMARWIADGLPTEIARSRPEAPEAAVAVAPPVPPPLPLGDAEIALPYEGEGRRLSVPVVFQHGAQTLEVYMMLDTGATYTTLPSRILTELGVPHGKEAPVITLHTANGERDAAVALVDRVWLGDLAIDGVSIATCDPCEGQETVGLLGLNVAGGFNFTIDADRKEVVFLQREGAERHLDVKPHSELDATFTRYPGGRVEVDVRFENRGNRVVKEAVATVSCGSDKWRVTLVDVPPGEERHTQRRLPDHAACTTYELALESADW